MQAKSTIQCPAKWCSCTDVSFSLQVTKLYYFKVSGWQDIYNKLRDLLESQGIKIEFRQEGIVTKDDLEAMAQPNGTQTMIVIDDNSIAASENKDVVDAFTKARHNNCSIILLLHFIFGNQNLAKIRANTGYYFLLKSCENAQQVALLGSKMGLKSALVQAYEQESRKPYGYVLIDRRTVTPYQHRIRRNIFEELLGKEPRKEQLTSVIKDYRKEEEPSKIQVPIVEKNQVWLDWKTSKTYRKNAVKKKPTKERIIKVKTKKKAKRKLNEKLKPVIEKEFRLPWW